MNLRDHTGPNEQWVAELDRELKSLPDHRAPATLMVRVMAVLEQRARWPWYRRCWVEWPMPVRLIAGLVCAIMLGGVVLACYVAWQTSGLPDEVRDFVVDLLYIARSVLSATGLVVGSVAAAAKHAFGGWLLGCVVLCGMMYVFCVGLGTVFCRLAVRRRWSG